MIRININKQVRKTFLVAIVTLALYLLFKLYIPLNFLTFFRIFTSFGSVSFSLPWIILPLPGIIIIAYNYFTKSRIWNLEHVTKESFIGVVTGVFLQILMVAEALSLNFSIVDVSITFLLGLFTMIPSIWFVTFLIVYFYLVISPHKVFIRRKRIKHAR